MDAVLQAVESILLLALWAMFVTMAFVVAALVLAFVAFLGDVIRRRVFGLPDSWDESYGIADGDSIPGEEGYPLSRRTR